MKTIGLIGGVSWVSTIEYYTHLNQMVNERVGGNHTAKCQLISLDFGEVHTNNARNDHEATYRLIEDAAKNLATSGAEILVICANTMHMHAERIRAAVPVELVHVAEVTAADIVSQGMNCVGLLGTKYVMEGEFYRQKLEDAGITVIIPSTPDREYIHKAIFEELTKNVFLPKTKQRFLEIIESLQIEGAQGVILGCTEIPILVKQDESPIPMFDTTKIHASAAVTKALA